jgi:protocatechuate 4,5-dioxygenase, beta chain
MAKIVEILGVSHSPYLPGLFKQYPDVDDGTRKAYENYQLFHDRMKRCRPDVLLSIGSDHLNEFFMNNMPAFMVGKPPHTHGPHPKEVRNHLDAPDYRASVDVDLAKSILRHGFDRGVDFAFSDEVIIDHSFTIPLAFIRPEMDLPIVPLFTNVMAPPVPPAQRFYDVGRAVRAIVDELPDSMRVGVIASGHLALDVGGPKMRQGSANPDWDVRIVKLIEAGEVSQVIREAAWDNLQQIGNVTPGFLNFVMLMGLAQGGRPSFAEVNLSPDHGSTPFSEWNPSGD